MELPELNNQLLKQDLFEAFKNQLKKDFESSGLDIEFADQLPVDFIQLKNLIQKQLVNLATKPTHLLPSLLYRIDISEQQIKTYSKKNPDLSYEELLSELIIKRILQKIILKRTYTK